MVPTVLSTCLIIYWNVNVLWILGQCRIRSTFLYLFKEYYGFFSHYHNGIFYCKHSLESCFNFKTAWCMNPKDHVIERSFYIDAFPWVHLIFSLKKYLDPHLVSSLAKYCGFYFCFRFFKKCFSGFSFALDILYPVCQKGKEKLPIELELGTHSRHWSSVVGIEYVSISFIQQPFRVFCSVP